MCYVFFRLFLQVRIRKEQSKMPTNHFLPRIHPGALVPDMSASSTSEAPGATPQCPSKWRPSRVLDLHAPILQGRLRLLRDLGPVPCPYVSDEHGLLAEQLFQQIRLKSLI